MPFISEIEKEKLISTFKSLPKETVSGNGSGWVNLVKFAPALKMSGLNFRSLGFNKLGDFVDATQLFDSCYDKTQSVPPKYIRLKDVVLTPESETVSPTKEVELDNTIKENSTSSYNPKLSNRDRELFELLHQEKKDDARTFNKPGYKGIWAGVVDKYKEKAHFVYELLQNADDAKATEATFILEKERLIFRHNGTVQFTISLESDTVNKGHINAITGVGNSTKDEKKGNTIGKFGVGFKAVFQYTQVPHIYDDTFWFKIEQYIIPTLLEEDFPGRKEGETLFMFPFTSPASSYQEIVQRLKNLDNPILFLRNLKNVVIEIPGEEKIIYDKSITFTRSKGDITHELLYLRNSGCNQRLHMFTKPIEIEDADRKKYKQYISVGYHLKDDGDLDDEIRGKVFCFFPTAENFNLHCIVHAPFLLVDSRQQLKDDKVNSNLKCKLAELAAEALLILRDYGLETGHLLVTENIFNFIPPKDNRFYSIADNTFRDEYISLLENEQMLLGRGDQYISSQGALICRPTSMMQIISDEQLEELYADDEDEDYYDEEERVSWKFLREQTQKIYKESYVESILDELDIEVFNGTNLASSITPVFMEKHGFKWAKRLYRHLISEQRNLWTPSEKTKAKSDMPFRYSPIILTSTGNWVAPYLQSGAPNVYLPLASSLEEYQFVSDEYLSEDFLTTFLKDLGLKEPDSWDFIQSVVIKKHSAELHLTDEELNDDLALVFDYFEKHKNDGSLQEKIEFLSSNFIAKNTNGTCTPIGQLYDYSDELVSYFGFSQKYIRYEAYKHFIDKYSIQDFKRIIYLLGVRAFPKIVKVQRYSLSYEEKLKYDIKKYTWCSIEDYKLQGFDEIRSLNLNLSKAIWQWLSEQYDLKKYLETVCTYQYYSMYTKSIATTLKNDLFEQKWIVLADNKAYNVNEVSLEDLEEAEYKIDYELIRIFGIEKKTKSLKELGATDSQIHQNELGRAAAALGITSAEQLREWKQAYDEKMQKEAAASRQPLQPQSSPEPSDESNTLHSNQRKTNLDEMSSSTNQYPNRTPKVERSQDERVSEITQKLADEANRRIEEENKRAQVGDLEKYSKIWFRTLLELEYNSSSEPMGNRNGVKITFERFRKETGSDRIYQLLNPSRNIPIWIEDLGGFTVKFTFFNRDDITFDFEVANVKDFTLRVKAKASDVELIDQIDWSRCSKAVIDVNSPVEIMHKLKNEFDNLPYGDDYNFRDGLTDNLSFVFGPPGTGKTTRLAEIIRHKMELDSCRILVLAPTNKACDVLTRKLIETSKDGYGWLGRFVATGEEFIESCGALIDRASDLYTKDKCCVVSTIARLPYDGFTQSAEHELLRDIEWDFVIVDEASMIPLVQIVYAIYKLDTKIIVAGDPLQIAPIVREDGWVGENIYTMVELDNFENPKTIPIQFNVEKLGTQFRSLPSIGTLYSEYCYNGKLKHNRTLKDSRNLSTGSIKAQQVNFVPFRVERFDSIYGAKKLQGSNVHVYSAIFSVEMCAYLAKAQVAEDVRIGVICPYAPQAQLINKMIEQRTDIPSNVEILVGTIHGFQGDQCDIIITVLNPPTGIKVAADKIMLNNRNIINVAISRASDYLFILLPHPDSYGYENLIEINKLCGIANRKCTSVALFNSEVIEKAIFNKRDFIESNTFVTTHQVANVYTSASGLYEVRIDENAVDIQTSGENYQPQRTALTTSAPAPAPVKPIAEIEIIESTVPEPAPVEVKPEHSIQENNQQEAVNTNAFNSEEQYYKYFEDHSIDLDNALMTLFKDKTLCALYTVMRIFGNQDIPQQFGWGRLYEEDVKRCRKISTYSELGNFIYPLMFFAVRGQRIPLKDVGHKKITEITLSEFESSVNATIERRKTKKKRPRIHEAKNSSSAYTPSYQREKTSGNLYDTFEYGMSDW